MLSAAKVLDLAWRACDELNRCSKFVEVLQCIVVMGNFLNEGTKQGRALGFKLETLPKVQFCHDMTRMGSKVNPVMVFVNNIITHSKRSAKFAKIFSHELNPLYSICLPILERLSMHLYPFTFQLIDFRGKDKMSLLHFLIQELNRERPDLLDFPQQMESVERASDSKYLATHTSIHSLV